MGEESGEAVWREFLNSGIGQVYLTVTILSTLTIGLLSGDIGTGVYFGGWIGLIAAIGVNELTPGYTLEGYDVV